MHMMLGMSIVLLTLILAGLTWGGRGRRWTIGVAATLLLLVVGAQVWMGILLMYDGSDRASSLYRFRQPTVQDAGEQGR
jgi:heme A synthase